MDTDIFCNPRLVNEEFRARAEAQRQEGRKYDAGKPQLNFILPGFLWEMGEVLTHGATKYGAENWRQVKPERYIAALMRHLIEWRDGMDLDRETGLHHLAHLACSVMFLWFLSGGEPRSLERKCKCPTCNP